MSPLSHPNSGPQVFCLTVAGFVLLLWRAFFSMWEDTHLKTYPQFYFNLHWLYYYTKKDLNVHTLDTTNQSDTHTTVMYV